VQAVSLSHIAAIQVNNIMNSNNNLDIQSKASRCVARHHHTLSWRNPQSTSLSWPYS